MLLAGGVVVAVSAGVSVTTPSATYRAAVQLVGTTIGVGASYDAFGLSIPVFFYGTTIPEGDSYHTVAYPAQISLSLPIISDLPVLSDLPYWTQTLKRSEAIGAGYLERDIAAAPAGDKVRIVGVSQGTQVAEIARYDMAKDPNYVANAQNYEFLLIGDPYQPNGGILTRFTSWSDLPVLGDIFPFGRPGPSDSPFKTTYYQNQYDGVADFPAYANVLSIANAIAGMAFGHAFPGYVLEYPDAPNAVTTQIGNTTYVMMPQYLPLLAPLRIPASLIGAERFVDALDPVLRVFVEMGYDRTADPSRVKEISWDTPQQKFDEAMAQLPGAFAQSMAILGGEAYVPTLPDPVVSDAEPDGPWPEHPAAPVDTSPVAQGVRHIVDELGKSLADATRPLSEVLQAIGALTAPRTAVEPVDGKAPAASKVSTAVDTVGDTSVSTPDDTEASTAPKPTPISHPTRVPSATAHSDSAPPRRQLTAAANAGRSRNGLRAALPARSSIRESAPNAKPGRERSDRTSTRAERHPTKQATKSGGAHNRPAKSKRAHAS
ncbi:PE-PPE domain-containing protein [Mycobacterium sp. DL440]|uniref:PE-PPE domain-containing protein n=1 Tax=Mycobacterium sp. DL440 TaxID=2675523 RepID=UPI001420C4E8|nr:PE-PPE domain-containing protein [Mycobacterium sp. DL440]